MEEVSIHNNQIKGKHIKTLPIKQFNFAIQFSIKSRGGKTHFLCGNIVGYGLCVYDIKRGVLIKKMKNYVDDVEALLKLDWEGEETIVAGDTRGKICFFNIFKGECYKIIHGYLKSEGVNALAQYKDANGNTLLISGGSDKRVKIWDLITFKCIKVLVGHTDSLCNINLGLIDFTPVLITTTFAEMKVWDLTKDECIYTLDDAHVTHSAIVLKNQQTKLVCGELQGNVSIFDYSIGKRINTIPLNTKAVTQIIQLKSYTNSDLSHLIACSCMLSNDIFILSIYSSDIKFRFKTGKGTVRSIVQVDYPTDNNGVVLAVINSNMKYFNFCNFE